MAINKINKDKKHKLWTILEVQKLNYAVELYKKSEKKPISKWKFISEYLYNNGIYKTSYQCSSKYYNDCSKRRKQLKYSLENIDELLYDIKNCKELPILPLSELPVIGDIENGKSVLDCFDQEYINDI